jgi:hypothetical protein
MDPFGDQAFKVIGPVAGAVIGLLPSSFKKMNGWLRKPRFELKIWCVPAFDQPATSEMYCIARLKVLKKMKGHKWLFLYPNTVNFSSVTYSRSRVGIGSMVIPSKGSIKISQLRKNDEVDLRFLIRREDAAADPDSFPKMVDHHLSPKIKRRKLNVSIDILPE